jgi:hypothetical protein
MATRGLFNCTDLAPLLVERGTELSHVQIWRLVTKTPQRLSLPVLAALCGSEFDPPPERVSRSWGIRQATSIATCSRAPRNLAGRAGLWKWRILTVAASVLFRRFVDEGWSGSG